VARASIVGYPLVLFALSFRDESSSQLNLALQPDDLDALLLDLCCQQQRTRRTR
jgi:hypothetical protein